MKKTTKFLTMALAAVMVVCTLTACGGDSAKGNVITFGTNWSSHLSSMLLRAV